MDWKVPLADVVVTEDDMVLADLRAVAHDRTTSPFVRPHVLRRDPHLPSHELDHRTGQIRAAGREAARRE